MLSPAYIMVASWLVFCGVGWLVLYFVKGKAKQRVAVVIQIAGGSALILFAVLTANPPALAVVAVAVVAVVLANVRTLMMSPSCPACGELYYDTMTAGGVVCCPHCGKRLTVDRQ